MLKSKTVFGMLALLAIALVMAWFGKLTPELVEVVKWIGGSFMTVRVAANIGESFGNK